MIPSQPPRNKMWLCHTDSFGSLDSVRHVASRHKPYSKYRSLFSQSYDHIHPCHIKSEEGKLNLLLHLYDRFYLSRHFSKVPIHSFPSLFCHHDRTEQQNHHLENHPVNLRILVNRRAN